MANDDPFAEMGDESPAGDLDAMDFMDADGGDDSPIVLGEPAASSDSMAEPDPHSQVDDGPLKKWQQNRDQVLAERKQGEQEEKKAALQEAKAAVEKFRDARREKIASAYTKAQQAEAEQKADMERVMESGTLWEKVGKIVDLQPKKNDTRDIDRMRLLLLQMKNKK